MRTTCHAYALLAILAGGCLLSVGCSTEADQDGLAQKEQPKFDPDLFNSPPADRHASTGDADTGDADTGLGDADRGDADRGDADRGDADRGDADRGDADTYPAAEPPQAVRTAAAPTDPASPQPYPIMYRMETGDRQPEPREAAAELGVRQPVPREVAAESAPPPVESHATHPAAAPATDPQQADHTVVKVFYGTDRAAESSADALATALSVWLMPTLISAGLTLILSAVAFRIYRTRLTRLAALLSLMATLTLAFFTIEGACGGKLRFGSANSSDLTYGAQRGEQVELGFCEVSIPRDHRTGELEAPSLWRGEVSEKIEKHVVLLRIERQPDETFFTELHDCVEQSPEKAAFVFIHGYNVTFEDAARRTAQMAYDLECAGVPIFYSWPSQGSLSSYTIDENNAQWTVAHLKKFLTQVAEQSGAERVNLIAHSMGNRALTRALQALSYRAAADRPTFHNVILTAPDIDAEVFRRDIAPRIVNTARRVTLYASSNDKALAYSKSVHGFPRAGDSGRDLLVIPGIDTIDVSAINKSLLGHSYYGSNDTVLADLNELLHDGRPPERRTWLRPQMLGEQRYWVFEPRAATAALPGAAGG